MKQQSLEASGFEVYRKRTRKEVSLNEMQQIIPWQELCEVIRPYYPEEPKGAGRKPVGLERMLIIMSAVMYLLGVQLPTVLINVPLNNQLQRRKLNTLTNEALEKAREAFDPRWVF